MIILKVVVGSHPNQAWRIFSAIFLCRSFFGVKKVGLIGGTFLTSNKNCLNIRRLRLVYLGGTNIVRRNSTIFFGKIASLVNEPICQTLGWHNKLTTSIHHKFGEFLRDVDDDEDPNWKRKRIGGKVKSWRQLQSMHFSKSANYWSVYQVKWTAIPFLLIFSF